jgi:cell fate regulator YaaT (PSP1 superfamily)
MVKVVSVNFRHMARPTRYNAGQLSPRVGDYCVVDRESGPAVGQVVANPVILEEAHVKEPLRPVLRKATPEDLGRYRENAEHEKRASQLCLEEVRALGLPMKLSQVEYDFRGERPPSTSRPRGGWTFEVWSRPWRASSTSGSR